MSILGTVDLVLAVFAQITVLCIQGPLETDKGRCLFSRFCRFSPCPACSVGGSWQAGVGQELVL